MENKNIEIDANSRPTHVENYNGVSDAVIIEIVHGIKEIIIELINRRHLLNAYHDER